MKKNILIMGAGYIGMKLRDEWQCTISDRIVSTLKEIETEIDTHRPDILINCIGYTGANNVDDCELDKDGTLFANTFIPIMLAEACLRRGIKLVHISSGCIYHFDYAWDPLPEEKRGDYFDLFYSRSKIYAEGALEASLGKYGILVLRIRIPLDIHPHPKNVLTKLIKYKRVIDIPNSLTYIPDFIKAMKHLLEMDAHGVYNVVNRGGLRYPELMEVYRNYVPDFTYETIKYEALKLRRTNLLLSTRKLESTGFPVRDIKDVLDECVQHYIMEGQKVH